MPLGPEILLRFLNRLKTGSTIALKMLRSGFLDLPAGRLRTVLVDHRVQRATVPLVPAVRVGAHELPTHRDSPTVHIPFDHDLILVTSCLKVPYRRLSCFPCRDRIPVWPTCTASELRRGCFEVTAALVRATRRSLHSL